MRHPLLHASRNRFSGRLARSRFGGVADPLTAAGFRLITDPATGLAPAGYTCARDQPIWLPQRDGSLASFAANVVPREWAGGQWWYRTDPAWVQHCLWSDEVTAARGWNLAFITPEVNAGGVPAPYPGGSYTRCTINSAGLALIYRTAAVTPGASETLSFLVRLGTLAASDLKFGIYNETAASWIAVDQVPAVTPTSSGWTRCDVTVTVPAGCTTVRLYPFRNNFAAAGGTFFLAAVCGTPTGYPVPLAPAGGSAVNIGNHTWAPTLAALGITLGGGFSLYSESAVALGSAASIRGVAQLENSTGDNRCVVRTNSTSNSYQAVIRNAGVNGYVQVLNVNDGVMAKIALRCNGAPNSAANGTLGSVGSGVSVPSDIDRLLIGYGTSANRLAGRLGRIAIHPTSGVSDALLQSLTA